MKTSAGLMMVLCLAACGRSTAPEGAAVPAAAPAPSPQPAATTATPTASAAPVVETVKGPSFDCASASGASEKLVCSEPALAALDGKLAAAYAAAPGGGAELARSWSRERSDCARANNPKRCLRESYLTRLVELKINDTATPLPPPIQYTCDDDSRQFTAAFVNTVDPRAAQLSWGNDRAVVFRERSASGSKYSRQGVDFWEHQGQVTVDFRGTQLLCTIRR